MRKWPGSWVQCPLKWIDLAWCQCHGLTGSSKIELVYTKQGIFQVEGSRPAQLGQQQSLQTPHNREVGWVSSDPGNGSHLTCGTPGVGIHTCHSKGMTAGSYAGYWATCWCLRRVWLRGRRWIKIPLTHHHLGSATPS